MLTKGTAIPILSMSNIGSGNSMTATTGSDILMMSIATLATRVPNPACMECISPAGCESDQMNSNLFMKADDNSKIILHASVLNNDAFSNSGDNLSKVLGPSGNILKCQQGVRGISMGTANQVMSQMIPTPVFGESQFLGAKQASSEEMGYWNVNYKKIALPQQFTDGKNGQICCTTSEQICSTMDGINMQLKNSSYRFLNCGVQPAGNNQALINDTTVLSKSSYLNASEYNNLQASSDQNGGQWCRQNLMQSAIANELAPLSGNDLAMNAFNLLGSRNLYGSASSCGLPAAPSHQNGGQQCRQSRMQSAIVNELAPLVGDDYATSTADLLGSRKLHVSASSGGLRAVTNSIGDSLGSVSTKLIQVQELYAQQHQKMQRSQRQQQLLVEKRSIIKNKPSLTAFGQKQGGTETHLGVASKKKMQFTLYDPLVQPSEVLNDNLLSMQPVNPEQSEKLEKRQVLPIEEQQETQSDNAYNNISSHGKPEVSLQELQSQKKLQLPHQFSRLIQQPQPPQQELPPVLDQYTNRLHQPSQQILGNDVAETAMSQASCGTAGNTIGDAQPNIIAEKKKRQILVRQVLLLYFDHAKKCSAPECHCRTGKHIYIHTLWEHITKCDNRKCSYPNCREYKNLIAHHQSCCDKYCPVCGPLRRQIMRQRDNKQARSSNPGAAEFVNTIPVSSNFNTTVGANINLPASCITPVHNAIQDEEPLVKRRKIELTSPRFAQEEVRSTPEFVRTPSEMEGVMWINTEASKSIKVTSMHDTIQDELSPPIKHRNIERASPSCAHQKVQSVLVSVKSPSEKQEVSQMKTQNFHPNGHDLGIINSYASETIKVDPASVMIEGFVNSQDGSFKKLNNLNEDTLQNPCTEYGKIEGQLDKAELAMSVSGIVPKQVEQEPMQVMQESVMDVSPSEHSASAKYGKSKKPKVQAVSLMELFTPEQIREHITGLRQCVGQSKAKAESSQAMKCQMSEYVCSLCELGGLTFDPPPTYCSQCWSRIKQNAPAYFVDAGDTRHCICISCYKKIQSGTFKIDGNADAKSKLVKDKIEEVGAEELYVQCDNCKMWQHSICVLFNRKRNEEHPAEYTCPNCYMEQIKRGVRKPLPQSAILGAKDLPTTYLSNHIEQRICRRLKHERQERAKSLGKSFEEVPGAEELVVRVVSSVNKILTVNQLFPDFLQLEDFPSRFPYKSKVLVLFQIIEGVEICLFCMFVQEFGSDCALPNQRRIYLSYLDSVKYFRPDVKAATSEALRTFVFHEILIGYLEYSKRRGFTSCYIWSSPPSEGDDYILNCHPEIQKRPQPFKLREWYLTMVRKASNEKIVVYETNMYDYFFSSTGERKAKVTAARMPFFDGDFFSDEAVNVIIPRLEQEEQDRQKHQKTKKSTTKRSSRAAAQAEFANGSSKDLLLMKKLGDRIYQSRKDFIMVHLQHACTHCCFFIVSGKRWVCKQCDNFQLCDKCYESEQKLDEKDSHPKHNGEKHVLFPIEVTDVPADTKDKDDIMECEFFDTRHTFLSLCRGNHYQFDTLRRAKHSSMMVLYHLHNRTLPAIMRTCSMCRRDIKAGQGWHSETCVDFDVCNDCYQKDNSVKYYYRLMAPTSIENRNTTNPEAHEHWIQEEQKIQDSVKHASKCLSPQCTYQNCQNLKKLFRHGMNCKTGEAQGCTLCKKMWYLLQLHARACKESECCVHRCKDLKHQRSRNQMELQHRTGVMEKMRQQTAETA